MKTSYVSVLYWVLRAIAAVILLQTLYFKFSAHPESVALFTKLGVEPWGRWLTGALELVTGILLLVPAIFGLGALLGLGLMSGAILSHLTVIGIASAGDGGQLFFMAILVWAICLFLVIQQRKQLLALAQSLLQIQK